MQLELIVVIQRPKKGRGARKEEMEKGDGHTYEQKEMEVVLRAHEALKNRSRTEAQTHLFSKPHIAYLRKHAANEWLGLGQRRVIDRKLLPRRSSDL